MQQEKFSNVIVAPFDKGAVAQGVTGVLISRYQIDRINIDI
jgi:hypothetical protein